MPYKNTLYANIYNYLKQGKIPESCQYKFLKSRLKYMATSYVLIDDVLYKRSFDSTLLRCLNEAKANKAIEQVHDKINGGHFNGKSIYHKLIRLVYYCPYMEKDCILHVYKCEKC